MQSRLIFFLLHGMTCGLETSEEMVIGVHGKRSFYSSEFNHNLNNLKIFSQNFPGSNPTKKCLRDCSRIVVCVRTDEQKGRAIVTDRGQLRFINITSKYLYVTTFVMANTIKSYFVKMFQSVYTPLPHVMKNSQYFF